MAHYNRREIGLKPPTGRYQLSKLLVTGTALHWPAMATPLRTPQAVMDALRGWQAYHMDTRGWSDIAYQLAVDQAGNTYGLRGLGYRSAANGGALVNRTHGAILCVVAMGEQPSDDLVRQVRHQLTIQRQMFPRWRKAVGHCDIRPEPTACPGPPLRQLLQAGAFTLPRK